MGMFMESKKSGEGKFIYPDGSQYIGYFEDDKHLYDEQRYKIRYENIYHVKGDFPRITEAIVPTGVGDIKYSILLSESDSWLTDAKQLFKIIFLRSRDWVYSKLDKQIEFDGLSRTKATGFFSLQPILLFLLILLFLIYNNFSLYLSLIPITLFLLGNLNFFKFLYKKDKTINLIKYIIIHFFFCFSVSLGALVGLLNYSFYRIFK